MVIIIRVTLEEMITEEEISKEEMTIITETIEAVPVVISTEEVVGMTEVASEAVEAEEEEVVPETLKMKSQSRVTMIRKKCKKLLCLLSN